MVGKLSVFMEFTVFRSALTETHLLNIGYQQLILVVCGLHHLVEQTFGLVVFHPDNVYKGQVVKGLRTTGMIVFRKLIGTKGISLCGVYIAIVIGI